MKVKMKLSSLLLVVFITTLAPSVQSQYLRTGSVVVVLQSSDKVVIAADSLLTTGEQKTELGCKVRLVNGVGVGITGLFKNIKSGYDIWPIVKQALSQPGMLTDKVKAFEQFVDTPLASELDRIEKAPPDSTLGKLKKYGATLKIVFSNIENGRTVYYRREFKADGKGGVLVEHVDCAANCNLRNTITMSAFGSTDALIDLYDRGAFSLNRQLWLIARDMVQAQIDSGDKIVGGPIDVLVIAKEGVTWPQHKPMCNPYLGIKSKKTALPKTTKRISKPVKKSI